MGFLWWSTSHGTFLHDTSSFKCIFNHNTHHSYLSYYKTLDNLNLSKNTTIQSTFFTNKIYKQYIFFLISSFPMKQTVHNHFYCYIWKQHLTCFYVRCWHKGIYVWFTNQCNTLHWFALHAYCLINMFEAFFNTSTRNLMSKSPENTSA